MRYGWIAALLIPGTLIVAETVRLMPPEVWARIAPPAWHAAAQAQGNAPLIPAWVGLRWSWLRLGSGLQISGDQITAAASVRRYSVRLSRDTQGRYPLPSNARNVVVHLNGLRAAPEVDYSVADGRIVPLYAWSSDWLVVADYDE